MASYSTRTISTCVITLALLWRAMDFYNGVTPFTTKAGTIFTSVRRIFHAVNTHTHTHIQSPNNIALYYNALSMLYRIPSFFLCVCVCLLLYILKLTVQAHTHTD